MAMKLPKSPPVKTLQLRWPGEGVVRGLSFEREYAAANYPTPWSINVRSQEAITSRMRGGSWTPISAGTRPSETIYRDRKLTFDSNIITASRMGSHADVSFSSDVSDTMRATAFQLGETDETGGTVVALVPHRDAYLLAATADDLWVMHGDPTTGQLRNVSRDVGMINANAWCKVGDSVCFLSSAGLYSVGADGTGLNALSEENLPVELTGVTDAGCTLTYHYLDRGVYIHLPNTAQSWFYDVENNAFWPFVSSTTDSHVLIGPVRIGGAVDFGMIRTIHGMLGSGSADVTWRIIVGDTAETVAVNGKAAITLALAGSDFSYYVAAEGVWSAGRTKAAWPRTRGCWAVVWLSSTGTWAFESVVVESVSGGRYR